MDRLTGYDQGTFTAGTQTDFHRHHYGFRRLAPSIPRATATTPAGPMARATMRPMKRAGPSYSAGGNTTTVTFDASGSVLVTYDAWGRVAGTCSTPRVGGPNGSASYTTYAYDALGRLITTTNYAVGGGTSGTQTYFDGANPIEVRAGQQHAPLATNVWSPADGRLILRDAVAAQLSVDTGLTIAGNIAGGTIQRLVPADRRPWQHRGGCRSVGDRAGAVRVHG